MAVAVCGSIRNCTVSSCDTAAPPPLSHHPPAAHELGTTRQRRVGALRGRLRHPALAREEGVQVRLALARDLAHDLLAQRREALVVERLDLLVDVLRPTWSGLG